MEPRRAQFRCCMQKPPASPHFYEGDTIGTSGYMLDFIFSGSLIAEYDEDDKEADAMWEAIDKRMGIQRKEVQCHLPPFLDIKLVDLCPQSLTVTMHLFLDTFATIYWPLV